MQGWIRDMYSIYLRNRYDFRDIILLKRTDGYLMLNWEYSKRQYEYPESSYKNLGILTEVFKPRKLNE